MLLAYCVGKPSSNANLGVVCYEMKPFRLAIRQVFSISKEELLKREAQEKKACGAKRRRKKPDYRPNF
jgi:hypothetical protein